MIIAGYHKEDIEPYLEGEVEVAHLTEEHWDNITHILSKWQYIDEDTLPDIITFYEMGKYRPNLPYTGLSVTADEVRKGDILLEGRDIEVTRVTSPDKDGNTRLAYAAGYILLNPKQPVRVKRKN